MAITTQTSGSAGSGPSKKIKLSLCPPDYLPSTVPTGIEAEETTSFIPLPVLNDIQENGDQIYRTSDPTHELSARLQRIWAERGDFSVLTEERIRNEAKEKEKGKSIENGKEGDDEEEDHKGVMTVEEMWAMKREMQTQLDLARGELTNALDLLNILSPPPDPNFPIETLPLPFYSLSPSTASIRPRATPGASLRMRCLAYAAKQDSVRTVSTLFQRSAKDIRHVVDKNEQEWKTWVRAKKDGWTLAPRGARRGARLTGKGAEAMAKDVAIFYGLQEASERFRARAYAVLDPGRTTTLCSLVFPPSRQHRRLQITVRNGDVCNHFYPTTSAPDVTDSELSNAQREIFEEELLYEIKKEATGMSSNGARVDDDSVTLDISDDLAVSIEMAEAKPPADPSREGTGSTDTAFAKVISASLRVVFVHVLRHRRQTLAAGTSVPHVPRIPPLFPDSHDRERTPRSMPSGSLLLVAPIRDILTYYSRCMKLKGTLSQVESHLRATGTAVAKVWRPVLEKPDELMSFWASGKKVVISGEASMAVGGGPPLYLSLTSSSTAPYFVFVELPHTILAVPSMQQLQEYLALEIRKVLVRIVLQELKDATEGSDERRWAWAADEIEGWCTGKGVSTTGGQESVTVLVEIWFSLTDGVAAKVRLGKGLKGMEGRDYTPADGLVEWLKGCVG